MATPHVSGLAALLASHGVTSPAQIRDAMEQTARDLGPSGWDPEYGWGLIDAHAALIYRAPAVR
jgi:serine protease